MAESRAARAGQAIGAVVLATPFLLGAAAVPDGPRAKVVTRFADPDIIESSGLVVVGDLAVTTNDSGDSGRVFTVSLATGRTVGVTHWSGEPEDVEALAPAGDGEVWVGDIGDNTAGRSSIEVARVPYGEQDREVDADRIELRYPDGPRDAESLLVHPRTGRLFVISKTFLGGTVYAAPADLVPGQTHRMRARGGVLGMATDAAFFPDGKHLIVRSYARAVVYAWPSLEVVSGFELPAQEQGEGIAVSAAGAVFASSEGVEAPLLRINLPREVRRAVTPPPPTPTPSDYPTTKPRDEVRDGVEQDDSREVWPWVVGGAFGLAALVVLIRSLRPR
jgi:hypothetical protein